MFHLRNLLRTIAQESASWLALRNCSKEKREEPGYMGVFAEKQTNKNHVVNIKRLLLITQKQDISS